MLNPFRWSFRAQYFAGFAVCAAFLAYAYYVQFQLGIEPCPLCIFQRFAFMMVIYGLPLGLLAAGSLIDLIGYSATGALYAVSGFLCMRFPRFKTSRR